MPPETPWTGSEEILASIASRDCNVCPKRDTNFEKCWWYWGESWTHRIRDWILSVTVSRRDSTERRWEHALLCECMASFCTEISKSIFFSMSSMRDRVDGSKSSLFVWILLSSFVWTVSSWGEGGEDIACSSSVMSIFICSAMWGGTEGSFGFDFASSVGEIVSEPMVGESTETWWLSGVGDLAEERCSDDIGSWLVGVSDLSGLCLLCEETESKSTMFEGDCDGAVEALVLFVCKAETMVWLGFETEARDRTEKLSELHSDNGEEMWLVIAGRDARDADLRVGDASEGGFLAWSRSDFRRVDMLAVRMEKMEKTVRKKWRNRGSWEIG